MKFSDEEIKAAQNQMETNYQLAANEQPASSTTKQPLGVIGEEDADMDDSSESSDDDDDDDIPLDQIINQRRKMPAINAATGGQAQQPVTSDSIPSSLTPELL